MAKVEVNITALKENESSLEQQITQLEALNNRLESLIGRIESSWEGDASAAYIRVMRNYASQAANMVNVLNEFKKYVNNAANTFETLDKKSSSRIKSSF